MRVTRRNRRSVLRRRTIVRERSAALGISIVRFAVLAISIRARAARIVTRLIITWLHVARLVVTRFVITEG
jgi:hypothetical protein